MKEVFRQRLVELRKAKNIAQAQLASDLGFTAAFIGDLETGKSFVSVETLVLLADYFNVSLDYLVGRA